jgi:hypothetical protein
MLLKKAPSAASNIPGRGHQKQLEYLYARRSAIDSLIRSLQEYDLSRMRWDDLQKTQSA